MHLDFALLSELGFFCELVGYSIASVTLSDALLSEVLQGLQFGHGLGQLDEINVGTAGLVEDLDASHQVISETGLNGAIGVASGTSHGKQFFCGHKVAFQSCLTGLKKCCALLLNIPKL